MTAEELAAQIAREIEEDSRLAAIRERIANGKARPTDAEIYTEITARITAERMKQNVHALDAPQPAFVAATRERYQDTFKVYEAAQRILDEAQGLHLGIRKPAFNQERAEQIGHALEDKTVPDSVIERRAESATENFCRSFQDDRVKANAAFRSEAGLRATIVRSGGSKCCDWCASVEGRFDYDSAPDGIWGRHDNCSCSVSMETGRKRAGSRARSWERPAFEVGAAEPVRFSIEPVQGAVEPVRLTQEQAAAAGASEPVRFTREQAVNERLTNAAGSVTMETAEERDKNAARRRYDAMTREQRVEVIQRGIREPDATFSYDTAENHAMEYLLKVEPMPNTFDVRSHGNDSLIDFFKQDYPKGDTRSQIDAHTLALILRGREDFRQFVADCKRRNVEPFVRLMSCNTGNTTNTGNCFAQLLANELGMNVYAPTKTLYANPDGSYQVGIMNDGEMKLFWSRRV